MYNKADRVTKLIKMQSNQYNKVRILFNYVLALYFQDRLAF